MLQDVPTILGGRYRIVERIGRGGMADVYRAEDVVLRRAVAIKVFRGGVERDAHLARFRAEVRTLAALTHPHLVVLYDAGGDVSEPWCAMEYVNGGSLADRDGPMPVEAVVRVGEQIATGLEYVHGRGIVHRDVKPSNVLLDRGGSAFLSDFGIARLVDGTRMTQSGLMIGTAAFLSPEQVRGRTAGPPSDVYALGLVLLEALTGRREYPGTPVESAVARLSRPPVVPEEYGSDWIDLIASMTTEEPADRPTPEAVALTLHRVARRLAGLDLIEIVVDPDAGSPTGPPDADRTQDAPGTQDAGRTQDDGGGQGRDRPGADAEAASPRPVPPARVTAIPRPALPVSAGTGGRAGTGAGVAARSGQAVAPQAAAGTSQATTVSRILFPAEPSHPPRNLLAWWTPDRRHRARLLVAGAGLAGLVAVGIPFIDGRQPGPLRVDSASGAGDVGAAIAGPPPSGSAGGGVAAADDGMLVRKAPVGIPSLPLAEGPAVSVGPGDSIRYGWRPTQPTVAGTSTTRQSPSPTPRPSASTSPKPVPPPSATPSPALTVTPTASPSPGVSSGVSPLPTVTSASAPVSSSTVDTSPPTPSSPPATVPTTPTVTTP